MRRRKYTEEFKEEAVKLAQRSGIPVSQTAKELGINAEMLRSWVRQFGADPDGRRAMTPQEHSEMIRLRRELKRVSEERDILKKR